MERVIGYLGSLLRQPSNPFRNFAAQTRRVATTNALCAMWPDFERERGNPRGSIDLTNGYLLLGPRDTTLYHLSVSEQTAVDQAFPDDQNIEDVENRTVYRWARLKLPTEQVARSSWKEEDRCSDMSRTDRNVKVRDVFIKSLRTCTKDTADLPQ
jgi:hypothetical protein